MSLLSFLETWLQNTLILVLICYDHCVPYLFNRIRLDLAVNAGQLPVLWNSFCLSYLISKYWCVSHSVLHTIYYKAPQLKHMNSLLSIPHNIFTISFMTQLRPVSLVKLWENINLAGEKDRTSVPVASFFLRDCTLFLFSYTKEILLFEFILLKYS